MKAKVIITAFENTSSEKLLKRLSNNFDKLFLLNNKEKSVAQLKQAISKREYAHVIGIGQRPLIKNKLHIETTAKIQDEAVSTSLDAFLLHEIAQICGLNAKISHNAGTSFCNNLYFHGLIETNGQMLFLHIPFIDNINSFAEFSSRLNITIEEFVNTPYRQA